MTDSPHDETPSTPPDAFERALTALLVEAFAEGTDVEGTWEITPPSELVPDWRIVVEKTSAVPPPSDGGEFLDG